MTYETNPLAYTCTTYEEYANLCKVWREMWHDLAIDINDPRLCAVELAMYAYEDGKG